QRHDQMRVRGEALPALEVIDARGLGDEDAVRDTLTGRGITLSYEPTEKVYLWTASNQWIGPLRLRPHGTTSHQWIADHHIVQSPIPVAQAAPALYIAACSHEGATRRFHVPQGRAGQSEGRVDWSSDEVMLKRVLRSI